MIWLSDNEYVGIENLDKLKSVDYYNRFDFSNRPEFCYTFPVFYYNNQQILIYTKIIKNIEIKELYNHPNISNNDKAALKEKFIEHFV